jgi:hypothetical protein
MTFRYFLTFFILFFCTAGHIMLHADGLKFRKYAGEFMEIGVDARAQAMGGAFSSMQGGVTSAYYNPAGMMNIEKTQISFMHTQQMIASVNYDFLATGIRQNENRIIALSLVRLGIDNIKDSRQAQRIIDQSGDWNLDNSLIKTFNYADYIIGISVAQQWNTDLSWGATIKYIRRDLAEYSANGIGLDFGLQKKIRSHLILGAAFKNVTTTLISWNTGEKELVAPSLNLGGSYTLKLSRWKSSFTPVAEGIFRAENRRSSATANLGAISIDYAAGLEYSYSGLIYVRTGIDEIERLNLGIGLQIPHVRIDYAFTSYDRELGNSHRVGILVIL